MRRQIESESFLHPKLDQIHSAAGGAATLVRQLMAFSRQQVLQPKMLNLNYVIDQFEKMLKRIIGEDIELVTILDPELGLVKADESQMEQIFMNLVVNARDAMPLGGRLTIETENTVIDDAYTQQHLQIKPGSYVMVAVSDSGIGIDDSLLSHIFEPFFTTKDFGKGTGLGLSTVHGIVKQSGGHILVYSEPNKGSFFKLYLPRYTQENHERDMSHREGTQPVIVGGTENILVVEDDAIVREIVSDILIEFGYTIWSADRASTALEIFNTHKETLAMLVTDVIIPGDEDGVELASMLCSIRPNLKVLYMSGYTNNAIVHQGILDKGVEYLQKPFLPEDLARKVRRILDTKNQ